MASARTPHQQKRANPPRFALFSSRPLRSQPGLPRVFRSAHDLSHPANPCGSELARDGVRKNPASTKKGEPTKARPFCITCQITAWPPTGFSFSARPSPSRKSVWRACSRWRPQEPRINKKGRTHQGSPFLHHTHSDHSLACNSASSFS